MPFPHPQSHQDKYRNKNKPSGGCILGNFFKRAVNITEDRNAEDDVAPAANRALSALGHDDIPPALQSFGALGTSIPNCFAYSAFSRDQPNFIAPPATMRPMGFPLRRRSSTSKQMCHPAAPMEMKRRSMLCHSVRRVPLPRGSSSHRIWLPPQLYSSTSGASARVTVVWETCGLGAATV